MERATFMERRKLAPLRIDKGWLDGYRLVFDIPIGKGERAVANLKTEPGARTCGVLYELTDEQARLLDRTEGVNSGVYCRVDVIIDTLNGDSVSAFAYQSDRSHPGRKPSALYMNRLLDGAREHGLPEHYIAYLRTFDLAVDERLAGG